MGLSPALAEKMILEEFGRSLKQIIHTASKTKGRIIAISILLYFLSNTI